MEPHMKNLECQWHSAIYSETTNPFVSSWAGSSEGLAKKSMMHEDWLRGTNQERLKSPCCRPSHMYYIPGSQFWSLNLSWNV